MSNKAATPAQPNRGWVRPAAWCFAAALLTLPAIAMQFSSEVNWGAEDFIAMGLMIGVTGFLIEVAVRISPHWAYRGAATAALIGMFLLIWVNLAVGVIGSEDNPLNILFAVVPLTAGVGAVMARFRAGGMRWALVATALAQAVIGGVAWYHGHNILPLTAAGMGLWLFAAVLFHRAALDQ